MKKRGMIAGVVALVLAGAGVGAGALAAGQTTMQGGFGGEGQSGGFLRRLFMGQAGRLMTLKAELNLTSEQKQQIRTIVMSHKKEILDVVTPLREKGKTLREAVRSDTTDEAAIRSDSEAFGKALGDAAVVASKVKGEVRKVLTPDQMKKIDAFRQQADDAVDHAIQDMSTKQ